MIQQKTRIQRSVLVAMAAAGILLALLCGLFSAALHAQAAEGDLSDITEEKIQLVRNNCVAAQVAIQRLQNSDVVTRTNRGRRYENILKLMVAFNTRVTANKLTEPKLIEATGVMQHDVSAFYQHYDAYRDTIDSLVHMSCTEQPVSFYRSLETLRTQRDGLRDDVAGLDKHVADYSGLVADLRSRLSTPQQEPAQ